MRSSSDAPSETEILELNPSRRQLIISNTGWWEIATGTLNVSVSEKSYSLLESLTPSFKEDGSCITYPQSWEHIPKKREEYRYYKATLSSEAVLVRCAKNPHSKKVIELFSEHNLRNKLGLSDGSVVEIDFH